MEKISVNCRKTDSSEDIVLPEYQTSGSSGMDLHAFINEPIILKKGDYAMIPCGIAISIPDGYEAQIRPRSGLAAKYAVTVLNGCGTIDSDYRGEINVILINLGRNDFVIKPKDRIAQMVFARVIKAEFSILENLDVTERNAGGFGHTGI